MHWKTVGTTFSVVVAVGAITAVLGLSCRTTTTSAVKDDPAAATPDLNASMGQRAVDNCNTCHHKSDTTFYSKWLVKWHTDTLNATTCLAAATTLDARLTCLEAQDGSGTSAIGLWRAYITSPEVQGWVDQGTQGLAVDQQTALTGRYATISDTGYIMRPARNINYDAVKQMIDWIGTDAALNYVKTAATPAHTVVVANGPCTTNISADVRAHIVGDDGKLRGLWAKKNREETGMQMFGCPTADGDPLTTCLADRTKWPEYRKSGNVDIRSADAKTAGVTLLKLKDLGTKSNAFWTRSSPDGRFVGNGQVGPNLPSGQPDLYGTIEDLQKGTTIRIEAAYDPGFAPDGKWFTFHGVDQAQHGVVFCPLSVLTGNLTTFSPINDQRCIARNADGTDLKVAEYHSMATALDAPFEFIGQGAWENDNGGNSDAPYGGRTTNAPASFGQNTLNVYTFNQETRIVKLSKHFDQIANQGDFMMAPSTQMVIGRFGDPNGGTEHIGYKIHLLQATFNGQDVTDVTDKDGGTICSFDQNKNIVFGQAKVQYSLDERFIVTHRFNARTSPATGSVPLMGSSSDVYIMDLLTGKVLKVTDTPVGVYALYPHFRNDGWLYFLMRVRDGSTCGTAPCPDTVVAADVGLILGKQPF